MRVVVGRPAALGRALQVCVQTLDDPVQGQCRYADVEIVDRLRGSGKSKCTAAQLSTSMQVYLNSSTPLPGTR
jgi:hypothetical protein